MSQVLEVGAGQAGNWRDMPCTPVSFLDPVSGEILTACADNQLRGQEVALQLLYQEGAFSRRPKACLENLSAIGPDLIDRHLAAWFF